MKESQLRSLIKEIVKNLIKEGIYIGYDVGKDYEDIGHPDLKNFKKSIAIKDTILWVWLNNKLEVRRGGYHADHWNMHEAEDNFRGRYDWKTKELSISVPMEMRLSRNFNEPEDIPPQLIQALKHHFGDIPMYIF
jgi:hypothetical protein